LRPLWIRNFRFSLFCKEDEKLAQNMQLSSEIASLIARRRK
jgi:hypothetical protein